MSDYRCRKCNKGILQPYRADSLETEVSEVFICSNAECRHKAVIPSAVIVSSQIFSSFIGGLFAAYLFIEQLQVFVTIVQFNIDTNLTKPLSLLVISLLFLIGLGYTLMIGLDGLAKRRLYQKATDHPDHTADSH